MHASYATYDFSLSGAVSMVAGTRSHVQVVALPSFSTKTSLTTFLLRRPRSLVRHPILLFAHSLCRANHPSRYRFGTGPAAALVHGMSDRRGGCAMLHVSLQRCTGVPIDDSSKGGCDEMPWRHKMFRTHIVGAQGCRPPL